MASRHAVGPDGRHWIIRERWLPRLVGLPSDPDVDAFEPTTSWGPFFLFDLLLLLVALPLYVVRLLLKAPEALFRTSFLPPTIEAVHEGPPYSRIEWRAANRFVGPAVIEQIARAIERGDARIVVDGATLVGFATRPDQTV